MSNCLGLGMGCVSARRPTPERATRMMLLMRVNAHRMTFNHDGMVKKMVCRLESARAKSGV